MPETREALAEFVSLQGPDLDELLPDLGRRAQDIVPELVGLSLGLAHEGLTFTLVSSSGGAAVLDAAQYVDGGPCVEVTEGRMDMAEVDLADPLDEGRWQLFSRVGAAAGVASSLSLPAYHDGVLVGGVNLYASTPEAFKAGTTRWPGRWAPRPRTRSRTPTSPSPRVSTPRPHPSS